MDKCEAVTNVRQRRLWMLVEDQGIDGSEVGTFISEQLTHGRRESLKFLSARSYVPVLWSGELI